MSAAPEAVGLYPPLEHRDHEHHWLRVVGSHSPPAFLACWHRGSWSPPNNVWEMSAADAEGLLLYVAPALAPEALARENDDLRHQLGEAMRANCGASQIIALLRAEVEALRVAAAPVLSPDGIHSALHDAIARSRPRQWPG